MTAVWLGRGSIAHAAVKIQCSLTNFLINNQILSYPRISGYPKHSILYPKGVISYDRIASLQAIYPERFILLVNFFIETCHIKNWSAIDYFHEQKMNLVT